MELPSSIGGTSWGRGCPEANGVGSAGAPGRSGGQITSGDEGQQQGAVFGGDGVGGGREVRQELPTRPPLYKEQLLSPDNPAPVGADNPAPG